MAFSRPRLLQFARPHTALPAASLLALGILAGCGVAGPPDALSVPPPVIDLHADLSPITGSDVLAAPTGWTPAPKIVTPVYPVPASQLFAAMQDFLQAEPRTWVTVTHPEQLQASFIVRSVALNLPDIVIVQAVPVTATTSNAVIFSRSRYDALALPYISVNAERTRKLLAALKDRFGPT